MARKIIFSIGNMYQISKDIHKNIGNSLKLDVDGIELLFGSAESLMKFRFRKSEVAKLRKLKYNTIHLPFHNTDRRDYIYFYNKPYYRKAFEKAYDIARQINAINLNMHAHQLKNPKVIEGLDDIGFTFENLTRRHSWGINNYKGVFEKNPRFGMLLDTSHGLMTNQLERLVDNFKDRIRFVHLSGSKGKEDDHILVHRFFHPNKKRLDIIKKLKCPVIIEAGREKGLRLEDFKKEIRYVRRWLNS